MKIELFVIVILAALYTITAKPQNTKYDKKRKLTGKLMIEELNDDEFIHFQEINTTALTQDLEDKTNSSGRVWTIGMIHARSPACPYVMRNAIMVAVTFYSNIQVTQRAVPGFHCMKIEKLYSKPEGVGKSPKYQYSLKTSSTVTSLQTHDSNYDN